MRKPTILAFCLAGALVMALDLPQAAKIRGHSTRGGSHHSHVRYSGHHHYPGYYRPYYYSPYYWGGYYGYYPFGIYYGYQAAPPVVVYDDRKGPDIAYVDTDVSPEKAAVYLDGEPIGVADDYDGFPDYLTVSAGRHTISFKYEGRRTVTRRVNLRPSTMLKLEFELPKSTGDSSDLVVEDPDFAQPDTVGSEPEAGGVEMEGSGTDQDAWKEPGEAGALRVSVSPEDASIYIDGKFVGTGQSLARLHGDLRLDEGSHTVEVVRPGFESSRRNVDVRHGDRLTLEINLRRKADR